MPSTEIPPVVKDYFWPHLLLLRYLGIPVIPLDDLSSTKKVLYNIYSVLFIGILPCVFTVTEVVDLLMIKDDIDKMTFTLSYFVTHVMGFSKIVLMYWSRKSLWDYCRTLEEGVFKPDMDRGGVKEFKIVQEAVKTVNFVAIFFHTFVIIVISNRLFYAAFDKGFYEDIYDQYQNVTETKHFKTLPFNIWSPVDRNQSPYYEIIFVYQIITTTVYGFYIGAADALITGFMIHIKAQFLILRNTLSTFAEKAKEMEKSEENERNNNAGDCLIKIRLPEGVETVHLMSKKTQKQADRIVYQCVHHHLQIILLCEKAEAEFNLLMLVQFLGSLALLCFILFQLSLSDPKTFRFISNASYLILMLFQLLLYCWNGNEVQLVSNGVMDDVYHSNWIIANQSTKKALLLMMMRAQRPIRLTAGKFAFLSVGTYTSILRGSASYFMVLRRMNYEN